MMFLKVTLNTKISSKHTRHPMFIFEIAVLGMSVLLVSLEESDTKSKVPNLLNELYRNCN